MVSSYKYGCNRCGGIVNQDEDDFISDLELARRLQQTIFIGLTLPEINDKILDYREGLKIGKYTINKLPEDWYDAMYDSYMGIVNTTQPLTNASTIIAYNENIYKFSSAKLYQQTKEAQSLLRKDLLDEEFNSEFNKIINRYSSAWQTTEEQHVFFASTSNANWTNIQKASEGIPFLQYLTVDDARVREDHKVIDGVIERVDSAWWNTYYPPNGYNCRCTVAQILNKDMAIAPPKRLNSPPIDKDFAVNWGKVDYIFPKNHSYFDASKKRLNDNFGLPRKEVNLD